MELYDRRTAPKRADTWFVYALVDSRNPAEIRYVGLTNNPRRRLVRHGSEASGPKKVRWIDCVRRDGADVLMRVLQSGLSHRDAKAKEVEAIAELKVSGHPLTNLTEGGDGIVGLWDDAEHRSKMVELHTRRFQRPEERLRNAAITAATWLDPAVREVRTVGVRRVRGTHESRAKSAIQMRMSPPLKTNKAGFKGVFFSGAAQKWSAQIKLNGKSKYLGVFLTPEEAARAYDKAAFAAWGSDCYLNFPAELAA